MKQGDLAPDFALLDQHNQEVRLSSLLANGPVVLFFYPVALSTGCTKETCHFRDLHGEFQALGAQPIGISMDAVEKQSRFALATGLNFPLLSDEDGATARAYGVKRGVGVLKVRRTTFVIGRDRRVLRVINSEINMNKHADEALAALSPQ
ncbi:MAG: peroxiredoxin [Actinomycetota bacterium]|jgi:peroxiredoxin Q/BCP